MNVQPLFLRTVLAILLFFFASSLVAQEVCSFVNVTGHDLIVTDPTQPDTGQPFLVKIIGFRSLGLPGMLAGLTVSVNRNLILVNAKLEDHFGIPTDFCYASPVGPLPAGTYTLQFFEESGSRADGFAPPFLAASNTITIGAAATNSVPTLGVPVLILLGFALLAIALASHKSSGRKKEGHH